MAMGRLSFPALQDTRARVAAALAEVSARPDAARLLGVSPGLGEEIARNTRLARAPAVRVAALYSGVLYDALDLAGLEPVARRRANRRLVVVSALYGALRPTDAVAPYRLSMAVNLAGLGPLAGIWRGPLSRVLPTAAGHGVIVDCRSSTYAAAWAPGPESARQWVHIRVPGATHLAKHTRGLVARHLCQAGNDLRTPKALARHLAGRFQVELHEPARAGRPWVLDTSAG